MTEGWHVTLWPRMGRGVKLLVILNVAVYAVELGWAYAVHFAAGQVAEIGRLFGLYAPAVMHGWVWQLVTHLFVHDPDSVLHILFNLLVLWLFGSDLEQRWGTRRFLGRYFIFGAGSAALMLTSGLLWPLLFGSQRPPALGASGAISGLVAAYCLIHWKSHLRVVFFDLTGRGLLVVFIVLDLVRVVLGEPLAIEGHWGGMATAALLMRTDVLNPRLLWLRFKRWRLKRRLRLERGGGGGRPGSNGDQRYLH